MLWPWALGYTQTTALDSLAGAVHGALSLCPASCPPFSLSTLSSLYAFPSLLSWQADCNPNLLLTSPLQLSQGPSKLNITHGDGSLAGQLSDWKWTNL